MAATGKPDVTGLAWSDAGTGKAFAQFQTMSAADRGAQAGDQHFLAWFERTQGETVEVAYPGVPLSLVMPLYAPAFAAHVAAKECGLRWTELKDETGEVLLITGTFECVATAATDG